MSSHKRFYYLIAVVILLRSAASSDDKILTPNYSKKDISNSEVRRKLISFNDLSINSAVVINLWEKHKEMYNLEFEHEQEDKARMKIFHENQIFIHKHNSENHSYTLKSNQFAHMTREEYIKYVKNPSKTKNNFRVIKRQEESTKLNNYDLSRVEPVDWREEGIVSPVKDQKYCGSCWAFATTGAVESALAKAYEETILISEQQLVDCAGEFFNEGCNGGYNDFAMAYIKKYGIESEDDYPYEAEDAECRFDRSKTLYRIDDFTVADEGEENLDKILTDIGPAAVSIDASLDTFRFYSSGIYYDPACSSYDLDHAVLAVGLDYDKYGNSYYIIKNSWGETWGDDGYINMARNGKNHCGVASEPVYATVKEPMA